MLITFAILLLFLFILGFWLIRESKINFWLKIVSISLFFSFCLIFWRTTDYMMGWAAKEKYIPEIISIRHVAIKEPNQFSKGGIYFLIEHPPTKYDSLLLNIFAYKNEISEPRLFKIGYSRKLHEELQKNVIPRLQKGIIVRGRLTKLGNDDRIGKDGRNDGKGKGSESQFNNDWKFYDLNPSYFLKKPSE